MVKELATVNADGLKLREAPSLDSPVYDMVAYGEELEVLDNGSGSDWVGVDFDGNKLYVSSDYVTVDTKLKTALNMTEFLYGAGVSDVRVELCEYARQFVGNPYVWGGTSLTKGADCSGFVLSVFAKYGISLPHSSRAQANSGTRIKMSEAKPGDLVFLRKGRQDQPRSDLYRWWSGDQCQLTEDRNPYCKCLLQNTGSGDKKKRWSSVTKCIKNIQNGRRNTMNEIIKEIEAAQLKAEVPQFNVGDTVKVYGKIKEGNRERIQIFEGTVMKVQGGSNRATFTVRKSSNGVGVEKTWPLHSPNVEKVEVVRKGKVRRAKLNYLKGRVGKKAKVKELVK